MQATRVVQALLLYARHQAIGRADMSYYERMQASNLHRDKAPFEIAEAGFYDRRSTTRPTADRDSFCSILLNFPKNAITSGRQLQFSCFT